MAYHDSSGVHVRVEKLPFLFCQKEIHRPRNVRPFLAPSFIAQLIFRFDADT
ncbi:astrotactin-2 isoform X1 [Clarias magur]|uniref:Astrotactin-2 isoform X1 n=1 Tax=Clarias magur TaxID=1594786 RepID=A0A8J4X609_CLAMG|nr:astrotactin-2 isoform X1 [Clarias magur]